MGEPPCVRFVNVGRGLHSGFPVLVRLSPPCGSFFYFSFQSGSRLLIAFRGLDLRITGVLIPEWAHAPNG